jgi:hypothetical protein
MNINSISIKIERKTKRNKSSIEPALLSETSLCDFFRSWRRKKRQMEGVNRYNKNPMFLLKEYF